MDEVIEDVRNWGVSTEVTLERRLQEILRADDRMMAILDAVRSVGPPDAVVGAGTIMTVVWDILEGTRVVTPLRDVDVAYLDLDDLDRVDERRYEHELSRRLPGVVWDVKNQAAVHRWYADKFGVEVRPLVSLEEAVATWPETCVCVAVKFDEFDQLTVIAPYGLEDLMGRVWRRNPTRVTVEHFRQRLASKRPAERWPGVTVLQS